MAQSDLLRKYLDAGMAFTHMTQQRAEAIVKNLVELGEVQREQAQAAVEELVDRSRRNTERMIDTVRKEVKQALNQRSLATKADIARLERRIDAVSRQTSGGGRSTAKKSSAKKKAAKKKAAAKKRSAKKKPAAKRAAS